MDVTREGVILEYPRHADQGMDSVRALLTKAWTVKVNKLWPAIANFLSACS